MECSIQRGDSRSDNEAIAELNRTFHLSPHENILTIALINIHYLYNIAWWCGLARSKAVNIKKLQLVQNAAIVVSENRKLDHIWSAIKDLGWLTVQNVLFHRDAQKWHTKSEI